MKKTLLGMALLFTASLHAAPLVTSNLHNSRRWV